METTEGSAEEVDEELKSELDVSDFDFSDDEDEDTRRDSD